MHNPKQNRIPASMRETDFSRLQADLGLVTLGHGHALQESGNAFASVYFPTSSIVSLGVRTRNGDSTALAIVGNEGITNTSQTRVRAESDSHDYLVTRGGHAYCLDSVVFRWELDQGVDPSGRQPASTGDTAYMGVV